MTKVKVGQVWIGRRTGSHWTVTEVSNHYGYETATIASNDGGCNLTLDTANLGVLYDLQK